MRNVLAREREDVVCTNVRENLVEMRRDVEENHFDNVKVVSALPTVLDASV